MIDDDDGFPEMYAKVKDVSMKITAAPVVILLRNVVPPPAPNTDWLPLLPNDAPISAPLPDCSRTTAIIKILTATCNIVIAMDIQYPLTGKIEKIMYHRTLYFVKFFCQDYFNKHGRISFSGSEIDDCCKGFSLKAGPSDQGTVNIRLGHQAFDIV